MLLHGQLRIGAGFPCSLRHYIPKEGKSLGKAGNSFKKGFNPKLFFPAFSYKCMFRACFPVRDLSQGLFLRITELFHSAG